MFYTYVIKSLKDSTLYYGSSSNPIERLNNYHNKGFERYTKGRMPWEIVYFESYKTRSEAMRREKFFKTGKGREYVKNILKNNENYIGV